MATTYEHSSRMAEGVVEFGPFRLDPSRRLLTRDDAPVALVNRAFDILRILVGRAPDVVSKTTLLEQVWQGAFVEESTLRFQIWSLRKALGVGEDGGRYISTVSGRGYCFVAPLSQSPTVATMGRDAAPGPTSPDTNLPLRLSRIIGREHALTELGESLTQSRFITIVGPGGVGKTRLAVELGWRALANYSTGVWLIDLAPVGDPDAVASAVATTLGVTLTNAKTTVGAIVAALGRSQRLLIFDNCEHVAEAAAALIQTLLERAPGVSILATSQTNLHLAVERVYGLDPLATPPADAIEIEGFAAVELFAERARAIDRTFTFHDGASTGIGEICRRLDGLPLAIEMAAGRMRTLGVEGLRQGLGARFKMLKGAPDGVARHASLRGMLEWSHGLLAPFDQRLFRQLSVFPGSFSLDAAIAIADEGDAERWTVIDALGRLIDHSLVALERREPPRYRLLETMRLYAAEKLRESGETNATAELHARHLIAVFDEAERAWDNMPDSDWIARYQPELDNLRAALDWALEAPERRHVALALAAPGLVLFRWLWMMGEGLRYQVRVMALVGADTPPATIARLLWYASAFYQFVRDQKGLANSERSVALCRELGDRQGLADGLLTIAQYRNWEGRYAEANDLVMEAHGVLACGDFKKIKLRLTIIAGMASYYLGDFACTRRYLLEACDSAKTLRSGQQVAALFNLGVFEYGWGNLDRAIELTTTALGCASSWLGHAYRGPILNNLGAYLIAKGQFAEARARLEEAFPVLVETGNAAAGNCIQPWAVLAGVEGRLVEAAQLIGAADEDRARSGHPIQRTEVPLYNRLMGILQSRLSRVELDGLIARGASWGTAEAIEFVASRLLHAPIQEVSAR